MKPHIVIVVPTYNEKENIAELIEKLQGELWSKKENFSILIVDDNSPDGTAGLVAKLSKQHSNIYLLKGSKKGLGTAYIRGFKFALEKLRADVLVQMDADFSHNPQDVSRLLSCLSEQVDMVIGSRYVDGGTTPRDWPFFRVVNSRAGNFFARYVAGIGGVRDCTSGFRAIKAETLKKINLADINAKGFAFQIELLYQARRTGAKIFEMPINFSDRERGQSKMGIKDISEFVGNSFRIRLAGSKKLFIAFPLVASLGFLGKYPVLGLSTKIFYILFFIVTLGIAAQGVMTLYGMLYAWDNPLKLQRNRSPRKFLTPKLSFTALLPALHEEKVIAQTIQAIADIDYPENLKELIVICRADDSGTINAAQAAIKKINKNNISLQIPDYTPRNKPDKLNFGLSRAKNEIVAVFDAEDGPHRDLYNVVNTVIANRRADVVQAGVQLVNFRSKWFSTLNVLEYFFWFKSVMHLFSKMKVVLLGGNTVFFKKEWLIRVGGWNPNVLTEDAEIGLRLSAAGARIQVVYDEIHATQEETPNSVGSFVRQRTRWDQGYIQTFRSGLWKKLPKRSKRFWAAYILTWPEFQALTFVYVFFSILMMFTVKLPVALAIFSFVPSFLLLMQMIFLNVGLFEFTRKYNLKYPFWISLKVAITFIPFQLLLGYSALRAVYREASDKTGWEKTEHFNAHREKWQEGAVGTPAG